MALNVAFVHIPKTAGNSVMYALKQGFGADALFTVDPKTVAELTIPSTAQVVLGHATLAEMRKNKQIKASNPKVFAVIRDPFERLLSLFNYNHAIGADKTTTHTVEGLAKVIENAPRNRQCEFLDCDGNTALEIAAGNYICALPHVESTLGAMFQSFGITPPKLHRINATTDKASLVIKAEDVPESLRQRAYEINARDHELYQSLIDRS
ncbi:sulfotransferase family 2 domain-containing protein [Hyphococcus formosus]|uniref:sulfotransferase family 2 domain-containing protein n=1 Tax=Hyphococcus formosus TaxID=3143534 RepID=UPI00398A7B39